MENINNKQQIISNDEITIDVSKDQLALMAYKIIRNKNCEYKKGLNKEDLLYYLKDYPEYCEELLSGIPEYFNANQKVKLVECIYNDKEVFKNYLQKRSYYNKTIAVQSKIAELVSDDFEMSQLFAEFFIDNWRIKNVEEHVKKLKITKDQRENLVNNIIMAKLK